MIKHYIFWELLEESQGRNREENALFIKENLESMIGKIPRIRKLEVGLNEKVDPHSQNVDLMLFVEFESYEDLDAYLIHPVHQDVVRKIGPLRKERWAVDYEV